MSPFIIAIHKIILTSFQTKGAELLLGTEEDGTGPIFLDRVSCDGSETRLLECIRGVAPIGVHFCDHTDDVVISCQGRSCFIVVIGKAGCIVVWVKTKQLCAHTRVCILL